MNNFILLMVATLEHLGAVTEAEAKKLSKELMASTLPDTYEATSRMVKQVIKEAEIKPLKEKLKQVDSTKA